MIGFVLATREDFEKVGVIIADERSFDVDTPTGTQTLFMKHLELEPDKAIAMHRAAPSIEWLTVDEMERFAMIYGSTD